MQFLLYVFIIVGMEMVFNVKSQNVPAKKLPCIIRLTDMQWSISCIIICLLSFQQILFLPALFQKLFFLLSVEKLFAPLQIHGAFMDRKEIHGLIILGQAGYKEHHLLAVPKGLFQKMKCLLRLIQKILGFLFPLLKFRLEIFFDLFKSLGRFPDMIFFQVQVVFFAAPSACCAALLPTTARRRA